MVFFVISAIQASARTRRKALQWSFMLNMQFGPPQGHGLEFDKDEVSLIGVPSGPASANDIYSLFPFF
jgi:hypothetical protein